MRERSPFGERLYAARTRAKLTQVQLAKAASISQSTLGELEYDGEGSSATVRLAMACGVRPEWLAEGEGEMVDTFTWPFKHVSREKILALDPDQLAYLEGRLAEALTNLVPATGPGTAKRVSYRDSKSAPAHKKASQAR